MNTNPTPRPIIYIDMDNVLVDFQSGIDKLPKEIKQEYHGELYNVPNIFALMDPYPGAIEAFTWLSSRFEVYILSTAPWDNPSAWSEILRI